MRRLSLLVDVATHLPRKPRAATAEEDSASGLAADPSPFRSHLPSLCEACVRQRSPLYIRCFCLVDVESVRDKTFTCSDADFRPLMQPACWDKQRSATPASCGGGAAPTAAHRKRVSPPGYGQGVGGLPPVAFTSLDMSPAEPAARRCSVSMMDVAIVLQWVIVFQSAHLFAVEPRWWYGLLMPAVAVVVLVGAQLLYVRTLGLYAAFCFLRRTSLAGWILIMLLSMALLGLHAGLVITSCVVAAYLGLAMVLTHTACKTRRVLVGGDVPALNVPRPDAGRMLAIPNPLRRGGGGGNFSGRRLGGVEQTRQAWRRMPIDNSEV